MVKVLLLFVVMVCGYLFYPFWDLYVRDDPFSSQYHPAGKGYWTHDACREAAEAQNARDFRCRKRTNFGEFLGASSEYVDVDEIP